MSDDNLLSRREFTLEWALAVLAGATITITGCGDDDDGPGNGPSSGDRTGTISLNHGHEAVIRAATLSSPTTISLDIRGQADHPHTIDLTAAQVTTIAANGQVSVVSTNNNLHTHTVTFN
jgi:hypothetical protein